MNGNHHKKWFGILGICICCLLTGCSFTTVPTDTETASLKNASSNAGIEWTDDGLLSSERNTGEKSLVIAAPVISYSPENIYRVNFVKDEEMAQALAEELIVKVYPDYQHPALWNWNVVRNDTLVASFSCDNFWTSYYLDVANDQDGITLEEDQLFRNFITEKVPAGSIHTSASAIDIACGFLNRYSNDIEFRAYNVLATEGKNGKAGFFTVTTEGVYKGIPISRCSDITTRSVGGSIDIGNEGIFCISALFLLKEDFSENVPIVDVEQVAYSLCDHFHLLTRMNDIQIEEIALQYYFCTNEDGTYSLRPVWCFIGSGQQSDLAHRSNLSFLYFADDGSFCGVY